ncbi:hypothetical protein I6U48_21570 [Clostridium sp. PL3]|uniref:Uncharacterized protein n=2 Tax=Clostridium thailandense TaxID=2794346 RepID=A0A949WSV2_9CLOT|nr:hypothetical protein [Clostridium thailandense]
MKTMNDDLQQLQTNTQQELHNLKEGYSKTNEQIQELQSSKHDMESNIKTISDNFNQVNKNIEDILYKLNGISEMNKALEDERINFSVKKMLINPLRKLTVGAVSSVLSVVDKTSELTCGVKEGLEDMVAEAQYQHKRKQMARMDRV